MDFSFIWWNPVLYNSTSELLQILLFRKSSLLFVGFCRGETKQSWMRRPIQTRFRRFSKIILLQVILVCNYYPKTICFKYNFFCLILNGFYPILPIILWKIGYNYLNKIARGITKSLILRRFQKNTELLC